MQTPPDAHGGLQVAIVVIEHPVKHDTYNVRRTVDLW